MTRRYQILMKTVQRTRRNISGVLAVLVTPTRTNPSETDPCLLWETSKYLASHISRRIKRNLFWHFLQKSPTNAPPQSLWTTDNAKFDLSAAPEYFRRSRIITGSLICYSFGAWSLIFLKCGIIFSCVSLALKLPFTSEQQPIKPV